MFLPIVTRLSTTATIRNHVQARDRGRVVDRTVRHRVALEGHPLNLFVCVKTIPEYYSTFFPGKVLDATIFPYI